MILYSIIMPVFNADKNIHKSIVSVIEQTYSNWELIIVNDGSTDDTLEIAREYEQKDKRIKVFTKENAGPGAARNFGISKCVGDYIAFIDSDDYYDENYLMLVDIQNKKERKDIIFVDFVNETKDGKEYGRSTIYSMRNFSKHQLICMQMTGKMPWGPFVKVIEKSIAEKCSFSNLVVGEEAIFSFDVLRKSEIFGFVSKPVYHYIYNEVGQHKKGGLDPWGEVVKGLKEHLVNQNCFEEYRSTVNSFALRALCINLYRCSRSNEKRVAIKRMKQSYNTYKKQYDFENMNMKVLDNKSIIIMICLKIGLYSLIYYASMIRKE